MPIEFNLTRNTKTTIKTPEPVDMAGILSTLGLGKFGTNSHPIHPATVHLPIAFILTSSLFDITSLVGLHYPTALYPLMKFTTYSSAYSNSLDTIALLNYLSLFSYASTVAAIITAIPAVLTGGAELYAMVQAKGLDFKNPVVKTTFIHAGLNDLVVFGAVYNWLSRRGREGYAVETQNGLVSLVLLGAVMYSAMLGGSLVYAHAVGVQRMGKGKQEKEQETKAVKEQGKKEL